MKLHKKAFGFSFAVCLLVVGFIPGGLKQCKASSCALVSESPPFQEWQRYTVKGEEFSVSLPALPAMSSGKTFLMRLRKNRNERVLGSYWNGVGYAIYSFENPLRQSLDAFIQTMRTTQFRGQVWDSPTNISLNGFAGKQFEFNTSVISSKVQFFETREHLYQFEAVGAPTDDPRVRQFFSSITLGDNNKGMELQDGIGAVFSVDSSGALSEKILVGKDVERKVVLVTKPEPSYTDSARQGKITGTVVLKVVFNSLGSVTNIRVISDLPFGLTEQAITAAKKIRFIPAMKDGQFVSTWVQLEYNFNLY